MKTYILIISTHFPASHPRAGEPTLFEEEIVAGGKKIHTIRRNYDLWKKRIEDVQAGNAYLSVRKWTGKPYRSKQEEVFRFTKDDGIGIQKMTRHLTEPVFQYRMFLQLAKNDGLDFEDFLDWFGQLPRQPLAIIHFTRFRYQLI